MAARANIVVCYNKMYWGFFVVVLKFIFMYIGGMCVYIMHNTNTHTHIYTTDNRNDCYRKDCVRIMITGHF